LAPDDLVALSHGTVPATLTASAFALAARAWEAFRSPAPTGLPAIAAARSGELRFLGEAFDRLCREYPATRDGLSLTERRILAAVAQGNDTAGRAFLRTAAREARPFLGDTWALRAMRRLATAPTPLLKADPGGATVTQHTRLELTEAGTRVLAGQADHVALNGIDRWIGGAHLSGRAVPWRWDDATEALVASPG
jgi:hypothetical protein